MIQIFSLVHYGFTVNPMIKLNDILTICLGMISELLTVLLGKEERIVLYLIESKSQLLYRMELQ